jgi:hypothetical protein
MIHERIGCFSGIGDQVGGHPREDLIGPGIPPFGVAIAGGANGVSDDVIIRSPGIGGIGIVAMLCGWILEERNQRLTLQMAGRFQTTEFGQGRIEID